MDLSARNLPAAVVKNSGPKISDQIQLLFVEDNDGDFVLARELIAEAAQQSWSLPVSFSITRVTRLREALERLELEHYDVVLLDLSLPDAQGLEAFALIKEAEPTTPIVLLTGFGDIGTAKQALAEGAQDFLVKGEIDGELLSRSLVYGIERKRAEQERMELESRLMTSQKLESLGVMAGGLAHDLNNLLQGILSYSNLALGAIDPASSARSKVLQIEKLVSHAADLVDDLFACSGRVRCSGEGISISQLVGEMSELLRPTVHGRIKFRYELSDNLPLIEVDEKQIRQVLANLITNGVEAMGPKGGTLTIRTGIERSEAGQVPGAYLIDELSDGFYVYLEVSDTGAGMDAATQQRIFEPFFTTKRCGRGLGLASVIGIIRGYKGSLKVDSTFGNGSTFRVLLPCPDPERSMAN